MKRRFPPLSVVALLPAAAGIALYLLTWLRTGRFTILDHALRFDATAFLAVTVLFFFILALAWIGAARFQAGGAGGRFPQALASGLVSWFPLLFLCLAPILLNDYLDRDDLRRRLLILGGAVLAALVYLKAVELGPALARRTGGLRRWTDRFAALAPRRKLVLLFLTAFLVYHLATLAIVLKGRTFSGDEPNYLLTTHSLLRDGDINLANNYDNKDYFHYYSRELFPRLKLGVYANQGKKGPGTLYPVNLPGIAVLMLPRYALSGLFEGGARTFVLKGSLAVWAALLGLQIFLLAGRIARDEKKALAVWGLYSFTAPVLFYATHLYPEVVIAFASTLLYRRLTDDRPLSTGTALALGALLGSFLWFGVKYNFFFGPFLVFGVYQIWRRGRDARRAVLFAVLPLLSLLLFAFFVWTLYGTFSPFAIYEGIMTAEEARAVKADWLALPILKRVETFIDYFLDQRDGLLLYAPAAAFALLGAVEMLRRRRREFLWLLFLTLPYLLNYALYTHRQGFSPQARVLMPMSWTIALLWAYFLSCNARAVFSYLFKLAALGSVVLAALLLAHPTFLYQPTTHEYTDRAGDLFVYLSNIRLFLPGLLPSFIKVENASYWPNYAWILGLVLFVLWYARGRMSRPLRPAFHRAAAFALLVAAIGLWALFPRTMPYGVTTVSYTPQTALGFYAFPSAQGLMLKPEGTHYIHEPKSYTILFSARSPLEAFRIEYGSARGDDEVEATIFDLPLIGERTRFAKKELVFSPPAYYRFRALALYEIKLRVRRLSDEKMQLAPLPFRILPVRD
jgi:hypothetical protein